MILDSERSKEASGFTMVLIIFMLYTTFRIEISKLKKKVENR